MHYRAEIDGLRALAVLPVILFHAGFGIFSGGYVGVDVFFVISGYLITRVITADMDRGTFSLIGFYERRARRILPALTLVLLVCAALAPLMLLPFDLKTFSHSILSVAIFCSNIFFWRQSGYFEPESSEQPLLHTWSLAVEEQFYLLFPLLLWGVWRWGRQGALFALAMLALFSLGVSEWGWRHAPSANFYLAPSRVWELLAGSLCALVPFPLQRTAKEGPALLNRGSWTRRGRLQRTAKEGPALLGLGAILFAIFAFDAQTPFPSLLTLLPVGGAVLIILCATPETRVGRFLAMPALVGMGLISYSAYLWHLPLISAARVQGGGVASLGLMVLAVGVSLGLAWATWRWVEQPFRSTRRFSRTRIFALSGLSMAALLAVGASGWLTNGFERPWLARQTPETRRAYQLVQAARRASTLDGTARTLAPCIFNTPTLQTPTVQHRLDRCAERHGSGIAVLGDSHAIDLFVMMTVHRDARLPFIVGITAGGCRPHTPLAACQYDDFLALIQTKPKLFRHVVYEQAGFYLLNHDGVALDQRAPLLNLGLDAPITGFAPDAAHITKVADYLQRIGRITRVTWFGPRFEPQIRADVIIKGGCGHHFMPRPGQMELFTALDEAAARAAAARQIGYQSQMRAMNYDARHDFISCTELFWSDGDHYSPAGEVRFARRLALPARFR